MDPTLTPTMTPAEAFARARAAIDAHEALIPALAEQVDPALGGANRLIVSLLRAQLAAAEAIVAITPESGSPFAAGYTTGYLTALVTSATAGLARTVTL